MMTPEDIEESHRILGLMQWVVYVQWSILGLHVVNIGVALAILLSDHATWMESLGSLAASLSLSATSCFAHRYQRRLSQELSSRLWR